MFFNMFKKKKTPVKTINICITDTYKRCVKDNSLNRNDMMNYVYKKDKVMLEEQSNGEVLILRCVDNKDIGSLPNHIYNEVKGEEYHVSINRVYQIFNENIRRDVTEFELRIEIY